MQEDTEGFPVFPDKLTAMHRRLISALLITLTIFVSFAKANDVKNESGGAEGTTESQRLKEKPGTDQNGKVSRDHPRASQPGQPNSSPRDAPISSSKVRQPDSHMDSRLRNVNRINRSFDSSMKNISSSIRKMNTDINKIRTLDRRDRRF